MVDINMRLEGLRAMEASLRALQKEYGGKAAAQALRPAVRAAMAPLVSEVAANTPVESGTLRDSARRIFSSSAIISWRYAWQELHSFKWLAPPSKVGSPAIASLYSSQFMLSPSAL